MNSAATRRPPRIFALILILLAFGYLYGGIELIVVGGSWYYALAGLAIIASGALLWRRDARGSLLYGLTLLATLIWALIEVGPNAWPLLPRVLMLAVLGVWFLTPFLRRGLYSPSEPPPLFGSGLSKGIAAAATIVVLGIFALGARSPVQAMPERSAPTAAQSSPDDPATQGEWHNYGNTTHGTRYARLEQITPQNVSGLKRIWHARTRRPGKFEGTPIQVGEFLYVCLNMNVIQALDAETGELRWEFDPKNTARPGNFTQNCRGVTYYKALSGYTGDCPERIVTATSDARMFAIDAKTGARCPGFGTNGEITLLTGMGDVKPGYYFNTSAPTIARGLAIIGGWVVDNVETNEPSGVVRAFDVVTGKFRWAWDLGRPGVNTEPAAGEHYTRGTPNSWSTSSYDDTLGLIYLPIGNATPDYVGTHRTPEMEKYASSVVALDVNDGSVRWSFQTVHHDVWDYDVPSQPALVDVTQKDGVVVPALVQGTKRGELFLLDRRDGKPIAAVEEKAVPQGAVEHDYVSKTQPFSVGMPNFREPDWSEARMWGITPFDQMWCRIEFRKARYEGHFTPPSTQGTLQFPGNAGGFNWGSLSVDEDNQLLIANPLIMGNVLRLYPRDAIPEGLRVSQQKGTPYAMTTQPFMSPLGVPCHQPPYGRLAVIDLQTQKIVWNRPLGTTNEIGPWGWRFRVPLPMGVPIVAGSLTTKGGLIFNGGTVDRHFRAIDTKTGAEVWSDYLPSSAEATPMSYLSPKTHRQVVIITVPDRQRGLIRNARGPATEEDNDPEGGHVIAYALDAK
jgi:quinate dehydrogenase (quinone)